MALVVNVLGQFLVAVEVFEYAKAEYDNSEMYDKNPWFSYPT